MPNRLTISQIFIPNHKQAANFVSAYQETVRTDSPVNLFLLVEIKGDRKSKNPKKLEEYEKIAQSLARALKSSYFSERVVSEATFEKALTALNSELAALGRRGVVGWYKRLNALVAVCAHDTMYLSAAGQVSALLLRKRELSSISESIAAEGPTNPVKTFQNFASGALTDGDCILFTTTGLYNYLSQDRLRATLSREDLPEASRQLVETLKTDMGQTDAFAAFVCSFRSRPKLPDEELAPLISPAAHTIIEDREAFSRPSQKKLQRLQKTALAAAGKATFLTAATGKALKHLWQRVTSKKIAPTPAGLTSPPPKNKKISDKRRVYLVAFLLAAILLVVNLIFFNFRNASNKVDAELQQKLETAKQAVINAESAMIEDDENRARTEVSTAEGLIADLKKNSKFAETAATLEGKIDTLNNQLNKVTVISQVETLGRFADTPDQLIKLPDGFLGFNSFTDAFEKLSLPSGQNQIVSLNSPVPENLVAGVYFPGLSSPIFLSSTGHLYALNLTGSLQSLFATSTAASTGNADLVGMTLYDNKLYSVDKGSSQILRYVQNRNVFGDPVAWLKQPADFSGARDLAVDGSIYVLKNSGVDKFTLGQRQNFSLPQLPNDLSGATRIHTDKAQSYIYLIDPKTMGSLG
ncbi:MAG: hypothetical protein M1275_02140, partial [Patescibacteria group bacterium]|nr:hypothetical protein [Patescibacteria group bacterium]